MMMLTSLSFGQIIKKDSLYCRTISEEKEVIKTYQQKDILDTLYGYCMIENSQLRIAIAQDGLVINDLHRIVAATDTIINAKSNQIGVLADDNKKLRKNNAGLRARTTATTIIGGTFLLSNIVLLGYILRP